jgi:hypothetical protein
MPRRPRHTPLPQSPSQEALRPSRRIGSAIVDYRWPGVRDLNRLSRRVPLRGIRSQPVEDDREDQQAANNNDLVGSANARHIESIRKDTKDQYP